MLSARAFYLISARQSLQDDDLEILLEAIASVLYTSSDEH